MFVVDSVAFFVVRTYNNKSNGNANNTADVYSLTPHFCAMGNCARNATPSLRGETCHCLRHLAYRIDFSALFMRSLCVCECVTKCTVSVFNYISLNSIITALCFIKFQWRGCAFVTSSTSGSH